MNYATFERAQLARWAYLKAVHTGSLACMKAICYVLRNRVQAGWGEGLWLNVIENHCMMEGNEESGMRQPLDPADRLLQILVRDIDDIYLGLSADDTELVVQDALYFQFIDRPPRQWFVEHIIRDPENHARIGQVGPIALFR
jgi:hypothetical protein